MEQIGKRYDQQEHFARELLINADAICASLDILKPHIKARP